jgi:hypothetical protein
MLVVTCYVEYLVVLGTFFVEETCVAIRPFKVASTRPAFVKDAVYIVFSFNMFGFANISRQNKNVAAGQFQVSKL